MSQRWLVSASAPTRQRPFTKRQERPALGRNTTTGLMCSTGQFWNNIFQLGQPRTFYIAVNVMSKIAIAGFTVSRDLDSVPRPVVALSATSVTKDWENAQHRHRKAQLIYSARGILNCEIEDGVWIVPPQCAIWIPGDLPHSARGAGETECYCLFVEPDASPDLPKTCCTISVTPLLRELLLKVACVPELYALGGPRRPADCHVAR